MAIACKCIILILDIKFSHESSDVICDNKPLESTYKRAGLWHAIVNSFVILFGVNVSEYIIMYLPSISKPLSISHESLGGWSFAEAEHLTIVLSSCSSFSSFGTPAISANNCPCQSSTWIKSVKWIKSCKPYVVLQTLTSHFGPIW